MVNTADSGHERKCNSTMAAGKSIVFVSYMTASPWGGSEELWAGAASHLARDGLCVEASVHGWSPPHARIVRLGVDGVKVRLRANRHSFWWRAWKRAFAATKTPIDIEVSKFLAAGNPALVVISDPVSMPSIRAIQECVTRGLPFVTISQTNSEWFWPEDSFAAQYRKFLPAAQRCYFVSRANRRLFEKQIGCELLNAEIVCNPFNVNFNAAPPWPRIDEAGQLRLANVARLHPPSKGQDILLEALADPVWKGRNWSLTLYGEGLCDTRSRS
jgi:hypothetical protein